MRGTQKHQLEALQRAAAFVGAIPLPAPLSSLPTGFTQQARVLQDATTTIESLSTTQRSGVSRQHSAIRVSARRALRQAHLIPLRKVARVLERTYPGIPHLVNLPKREASEQSLLETARAALKDITPYHDLFIEKGLPDDFLLQLQGAITSVEHAAAVQDSARRGTTAATAGIAKALQDGRDAVHCLDAIIRRACNADTVDGALVLRDWESARRVRRSSGAGSSTPVTEPASSDTSSAVQATTPVTPLQAAA